MSEFLYDILGHPEAEDDNDLIDKNAFVHMEEYEHIMDNAHIFIIASKGGGRTALARYIKQVFSKNYEVFLPPIKYLLNNP